MKQTAPLYLNLPLKTAFCSVVLLFLERWAFTSFKLLYFWISRSNSTMKGDEGGIVSKTSDWISLFLLKIKIQHSSGCPSKEFNVIFMYINEKNISAYPRRKKIWIDWRFKNFLAYWKKLRVKRGVVKQVRFVPNTVGGGLGRA